MNIKQLCVEIASKTNASGTRKYTKKQHEYDKSTIHLSRPWHASDGLDKHCEYIQTQLSLHNGRNAQRLGQSSNNYAPELCH